MTSLEELSASSNMGCDQSEVEEWSDKQCILKCVEDNFPLIVKDTKVQKKIINSFLNFYLTGKVPTGLTIGDLVFAVISIMPVSFESEEFIFKDHHYKEDGTLFFLTPDHKLKAEIQSVLNNRIDKQINKIEEQEQNIKEDHSLPDGSSSPRKVESNEELECEMVQITDKDNVNIILSDSSISLNELQWYRKKINTSITQVTVEYGANENAAFCISCNNLLDQWDINVRARTNLKYFFAMTALILLRGTVKTYQNVNNYFRNGLSKHLLCTGINYSVPHNAFIKKACKKFHTLDDKTQIMFSKLVITSFDNHEKLKYFYKNNILRFAVLSHTADFGMGIISMLQIIASNTYSFAVVFDILNTKELEETWLTVYRFFKRYMVQSARQYTYHWASIIDNNQFKYLSCINNYAFAVVLAVFIEKLTQNSGIWRSVWVKGNKELEAYKDLGLKLYTKYSKKSIKLELFFSSLPISS